MSGTVRIEVPKGVDYHVAVTTQSKKWDTEKKAYADDWVDDAEERTFLPGVNGWVTIHGSSRISCIEERPLTAAMRSQLGLPALAE